MKFNIEIPNDYNSYLKIKNKDKNDYLIRKFNNIFNDLVWLRNIDNKTYGISLIINNNEKK